MNHKLNILVSGSIAIDRIMDFPGYFRDHILPDKIHNLNVAFNITELRENFGGCAGNIAYNLALLSERPFVLATVGDDFGAYKKRLKGLKIDVSQVRVVEAKKCASAYIITDKSDNQITGFNMGAMATALGSFSDKLLKNSLAIVSPGNILDMENYARLYTKRRVKYIFDPGQALNALSGRVVKMASIGADIVIGNDYEIELIKKRAGWTTDELIGKVRTLIVTKGEHGSEILTSGKRLKIKAARVKKLADPTGAGDAYRAGLIKGLVLGWELEKCAKLGSVVASYAVEKYGTQNHNFNWKDLEKRYKLTYKEKI